MIPLLVCGGIGLLIAIVCWWPSSEPYDPYGYDDFDDPGAGFAAIFGMLMIGSLLAMVIGAFAYNGSHPVVSDPISLKTMQDNTQTEGHFFLGSGTIEGIPHYSWYEQIGPNDYVRRDVESSSATIHYVEDGRQPYYTITSEESDHKGFLQTWGFNTSSDGWYNEYDFYVPKGTISNEYKLDAK